MKKNSITDIRDFYHHNANNENENENKIVNNITNGNIQPSAKGKRLTDE